MENMEFFLLGLARTHNRVLEDGLGENDDYYEGYLDGLYVSIVNCVKVLNLPYKVEADQDTGAITIYRRTEEERPIQETNY